MNIFRDFDTEKLFSKQLENISLNDAKMSQIAQSETLSTTATSTAPKVPPVQPIVQKAKKNESSRSVLMGLNNFFQKMKCYLSSTIFLNTFSMKKKLRSQTTDRFQCHLDLLLSCFQGFGKRWAEKLGRARIPPSQKFHLPIYRGWQ